MTDPLRKVQSGERLRLPASAYNAFVDAARAERSRQHDRLQEPAPESRQAGIVRVRNESGAARNRFDVLGIDEPLILPADNLQQFQHQVALVGVTPTAGHEGRFVILLEPLAIGATGRAVLAGISPARVELLDPDHLFADVKPSDATKLVSGRRGSARILWHDAGSDWAVVRIGNPSSQDIHLRFAWVTDPAGAPTYNSVVLDSPYGDAFDVFPGVLGTAAIYRWDPPTSFDRLALDKDDNHDPDITVQFASPYFNAGIGGSFSEGSLILLVSNVELEDGLAHGTDGVQIWGFYLEILPKLRDIAGYGASKCLTTNGSGVIQWDDCEGAGGGWPTTEWPDFNAFLSWLVNFFAGGCGLRDEGGTIGVDPEELTATCSVTSLAPVAAETSCAIKVLVGCGLERETNIACGADCEDGGPGSLKVDPEAIAGKGLIEDDDNGDCDCAIMLDLGCGLGFDDEEMNKVRVKVDPNGCIECDDEDGLKVNLNPDGCLNCLPVGLGVTLAENGCLTCGVGGLSIDANTLAGSGLTASGCVLNVNVGNCLEVVGDVLNVKVHPTGCLQCTPSGLGVDLVAGAGLGASGCTFFVNVGDCLEIVSDAVNVKLAENSCLECVAGGLKVSDDVITDIQCFLTLENGMLKLRLEKKTCGNAAWQTAHECTLDLFECTA